MRGPGLSCCSLLSTGGWRLTGTEAQLWSAKPQASDTGASLRFAPGTRGNPLSLWERSDHQLRRFWRMLFSGRACPPLIWRETPLMQRRASPPAKRRHATTLRCSTKKSYRNYFPISIASRLAADVPSAAKRTAEVILLRVLSLFAAGRHYDHRSFVRRRTLRLVVSDSNWSSSSISGSVTQCSKDSITSLGRKRVRWA